MSAGVNRTFWQGKRVFVTGHTGFKGGWLSLWLSELGASVFGYALAPPTDPSFFEEVDLSSRLAKHTLGDIRDLDALCDAMHEAKPDIVLHLAAQSLVRPSYDSPVETYATNVMGTVHVLEAVRRTSSVKAVVNVTTDKCYENREWIWPYRENEAMGGADPYSNSKGCSELVTAAYRSSFLAAADVRVGSARAGNVIGGGDWAVDRLVPDFFRALDAGQPLVLRYPGATRPWQHVLEPLSGYLMLAERLFGDDGANFADGWNFGPAHEDTKPVQWIAEHLCNQVPNASWESNSAAVLHEANTLKLDSSKARNLLAWNPQLDLAAALDLTLQWHQAWKAGGNSGTDMAAFSLNQINAYSGVSLNA